MWGSFSSKLYRVCKRELSRNTTTQEVSSPAKQSGLNDLMFGINPGTFEVDQSGESRAQLESESYSAGYMMSREDFAFPLYLSQLRRFFFWELSTVNDLIGVGWESTA